MTTIATTAADTAEVLEAFIGHHSGSMRFAVRCGGEYSTITLSPNSNAPTIKSGVHQDVGDIWPSTALLSEDELTRFLTLAPQLKLLDEKFRMAIFFFIDVPYSQRVVDLKNKCLAAGGYSF